MAREDSFEFSVLSFQQEVDVLDSTTSTPRDRPSTPRHRFSTPRHRFSTTPRAGSLTPSVLLTDAMDRLSGPVRPVRPGVGLLICTLLSCPQVFSIGRPLETRAVPLHLQHSIDAGETQDTAPTQAAARLIPGKPIERELAAGQSHFYSITLEAGQYLRVIVDQRGIDVLVALLGPDGKEILAVDSPLGSTGPEPLAVIAGSSGEFLLKVRAVNSHDPPGKYEARIVDLRSPIAEDRVRAAAHLLFAEGENLHARGTGESWRQALAKFEESLTLWRGLGDHLWEAHSLIWSGLLHLYLGEFQKSLDKSNQALNLYRAEGQRQAEAWALNDIGVAYDSLGERLTALDYYSQSLAVDEAAGHKERQVTTLNNMAKIHDSLGEPQKALQCYARALSLSRAAGYGFGEAYVLTGMGAAYSALGDQQRALEYYSQALPLSRSRKDMRTEGSTLARMAASYAELGDEKNALDYYAEAARLQTEAGDRLAAGMTMMQLGSLYGRLGDSQRGLDYCERALGQLREMGDRWGEALALFNIGLISDKQGDSKRALDYYDKSLPLCQAVGDQRAEANTLRAMGRAYSRLGNLSAARASIEADLAIIEKLRTRVASDELRQSYFASVQDDYALYADVLMRLNQAAPGQGYDARALEASERGRARSLLDLLSESRAEIRQGIHPALLSRETELRQRLNTVAAAQINMLSRKHTDAAAASLSSELDSVRTQYEDVEAEIRARSPRYAALTQPSSLDISEVQKQILDPDTLLMEYMLGPENSYLWVIGSTSISSYRLPGRAEIEAAARRVYDVLALYQPLEHDTLAGQRVRQAKADRDYPAAVRALSQMVLGPALSSLGDKRLLIVADGALQYIPFAALPIPPVTNTPVGRLGNTPELDGPAFIPLVTQHEIVSAPSASVLAALRRETLGRDRPSKAVAVLADPVFDADDPRLKGAPSGQQGRVRQVSASSGAVPASQQDPLVRALRDLSASGGPGALSRLPFTRQEAQAITSLVPSGQGLQALDFTASKEVASGVDLRSYRIVHFATHGLLDDQHPELSGLVLSLVNEQGLPKDGFLRLNEIYNMRLPADLVVLSACQTGLGKQVRGEGLIGLTRGFMYAGAQRVVASLWKVDDAATRELMKRFYGNMFKSRLTPAAALRAAQLEMAHIKQWQAPYYWAGFVLQGEWK
jgi:CHAT domain-containing protein/tetratricopeptide (TPR) repeat protein